MKINENEAMRYAGLPADHTSDYRTLTEQLAKEVETISQPRMVCKIFELQHAATPETSQREDIPLHTQDVSVPSEQTKEIYIPQIDLYLPGQSAKQMLKGCHHVIVLAATLGSVFDYELQKYMHTDMAKALLFDACGSAGIESYLDEVQTNLQTQLNKTYPSWHFTDRFSCGYGDLPLQLQKDISQILDLPKTAGIYVQPSLMMNPTKSVTAFIGISDTPQPARIRGCDFCSMQNTCKLRKAGKTCSS